MTSAAVAGVLRRAVPLLVCLGALGWARPATAQVTAGASLSVQATFGTRVKVVFDRTTVSLDTQAYDPDTVTMISADPLTLSAKARVEPNTRVVLTLQAGSHLQSGTDTIPAQKLTWTIVGPGFQPNGTANPNAARMIGQWRGSGDWTGTQVYSFEDSWTYAVGTYSVVMTYTFSTP
jgi:hypothetical protein